jgi:acyl carrier protein
MNGRNAMNEGTHRLKAEIAKQLEGDILSYGWLLQITTQVLPDEPFEVRSVMLIDALAALVNELGVTIGPTTLLNGKVHITNWGQTKEATIDALRHFIELNGEPGNRIDIDFGFWVGLPA